MIDIVLSVVIGALLGTMLALIRMYNKQIMELNKALMAKSLADYTVSTIPVVKDEPKEEVEIIPAEQMTDEEFDHIIEEQLNAK